MYQDHVDRRRGWLRLLLLSPLLLLLILPWCRREGSTEVPIRDPSYYAAPVSVPALVLKELGPPPYWVEEGNPLPGRPDVGLPIPKSVFKSVALRFDGKPAGQEPFRFKAGQTVKIEGEIDGYPNLPINVNFGAGACIVCKSDNAVGWVILKYGGGNSNTSQRHGVFDFTYTFPNRPGEYLFVVCSTADCNENPHPIYLAAQYLLVLE